MAAIKQNSQWYVAPVGQLAYSVFDTNIGKCLVAVDSTGLVGLQICGGEADSLVDLVADLLASPLVKHSGVAPQNNAEAVRPYALALMGLLEGKPWPNNCVVSMHGTAFQLKVWQTLMTIPFGKTVSYGELAMMIGQPKAVRAVASACAKNSLAIVVPCHRVVGANGKLTGYRWGMETKAALLRLEAALPKLMHR